MAAFKSSVVRVVPDEDDDEAANGCAFRVIALAIRLARHPLCRARDLSKTDWRRMSRDLWRRSGLTWGTCGIPELNTLHHVLKTERVRLYVYYHHLKCLAYAGPRPVFAPDGPLHDIYLYHHEDHYDVIRNMKGFLQRSYYCTECEVGYNNANDHRCHPLCRRCYASRDRYRAHLNSDKDWWVTCQRCHRHFKGEQCYANHLQTTVHFYKEQNIYYSICQRYQRCVPCGQVVDVLKRLTLSRFKDVQLRNLSCHVCGEEYCPHCKKTVPRHWCYVPTVHDVKCQTCQQGVTLLHTCAGVVQEYEEKIDSTYLFFDVETMPGKEVHVVNLVVAHKVCTECLAQDHDPQAVCDICQDRRRVFTTRDAFCQWLFHPRHYGFIVMAHNFKGYDSYFLLEYLCRRGERPNVTFRGAKLLYMELERLNFKLKDSLAFLPMPTFLIDRPTRTMWDLTRPSKITVWPACRKTRLTNCDACMPTSKARPLIFKKSCATTVKKMWNS